MTELARKDRLQSWKAIARYLGRSERTVRRWEQHEKLPIHRLMHKSQGSVFAIRQELDDWVAARARGPIEQAAEHEAPGTPAGAGDASQRGGGDDDAAIAVLPFSFAGPDPAQAWVADGLTEEMIAGFSRLEKLRVTSRTSSAALRDSDRESNAIADLLGVTYLLEGGIVGDGRRLRINVRLIDAERDDHVWSRRFDGDMEQIFDIQEQIARAVTDALQLRLVPADEAAIQRREIDDISAWRRVVLARAAALRWQPDALQQARELLTEALERTGENATICATMGRVLLNYREAGIATQGDLLEEARRWAERARAADADHPETRVLSGWLAHAAGDLGRAIEELETALEKDRDHPDALLLLAYSLARTGQTERARPIIDHLVAVDPLTPLTRCMPGFLDALEGRFEPAIGPYRDMLERDPDNPVARLFNVWVLFAAGRGEEATEVFGGFEGPAEQSTPARLAWLLVEAHRGRREAMALPAAIEEASFDSEMYARHAAEAWGMAGDAKRSAEWLDRTVELGFLNWPYLAQHSPFLKPVIDDAALRPVLDKAKRRWRRLCTGK